MSSKLLNLGVGISIAVGAGACTQAEQPSLPTTEHYSVSKENSRWAERTFKNVGNFWRERGIGMKALDLVVLSGNDTFQCNKESKQVTSTSNTSFYCSPNHTIVIPGAEFAAKWTVNGKKMGRQVIKFTIEHEVGHYVDEETGGIQFDRDKKSTVGAELLATCYAGQYAATRESPVSIDRIASFLQHLPKKNANPGHGTRTQQAGAYRRGASSGACQRYDDGM